MKVLTVAREHYFVQNMETSAMIGTTAISGFFHGVTNAAPSQPSTSTVTNRSTFSPPVPENVNSSEFHTPNKRKRWSIEDTTKVTEIWLL